MPAAAWQRAGRAARPAAFAEAADAVIVDSAPVEGNEFKVPLLRRTVIAVLRDLAAEAATGRSGANGEDNRR